MVNKGFRHLPEYLPPARQRALLETLRAVIAALTAKPAAAPEAGGASTTTEEQP